MRDRYDVIILGGGLAGLTLARQLLRETDKSVLILERRPQIPGERQKVGESTVQLAGYYLSRVLGLEEHLLRRHFLKYNLRFYWPVAEAENRSYEEYSQSFIREMSNIASYQVDRNALERELLRLNHRSRRFTLQPAVRALDVQLCEEGDHTVGFRVGKTEGSVRGDWVVDATGRVRHLARSLGLGRRSPVRHGAFFWWVEGLVDVEKLTDLSPRQIRLRPERRKLGHLPAWLATSHFMTEGAWFWVIPLHGKTSLGLVYDRDVVEQREVFSVEKATRWVCERFPVLARDLPRRKVLESGGFKNFSHDSVRTISPDRWASTGEAGRFSDPLYSPGSDLIAVHNTLIVDAVGTDDRKRLAAKCAIYDQLMRAAFNAYEPSYTVSYDALGDQESFSLKYVWELSVYFGFYVFPFINDLLTERRFLPGYLRAFSRLGLVNAGVQRLLSGYFQWKKSQPVASEPPRLFDFSDLGPLSVARETFYEVGVSVDEARRVVATQLTNLEELARFIAAWVAARVAGEPGLLTDRRFVEAIDLDTLRFDADAIRVAAANIDPSAGEPYRWSFDPSVMEPFGAIATQRPRAVADPMPILTLQEAS